VEGQGRREKFSKNPKVPLKPVVKRLRYATDQVEAWPQFRVSPDTVSIPGFIGESE
jgi:hypothetical protein